MKIIFRNLKRQNLEPVEVDNNFLAIKQAIDVLEDYVNFDITILDNFEVDLNTSNNLVSDIVTTNYDSSGYDSYGSYGSNIGIGIKYLYIDPFLTTFSGQYLSDILLINKNNKTQKRLIRLWVGGDIFNVSINSFNSSLGSLNSSFSIQDNKYLCIDTTKLIVNDIINLSATITGNNNTTIELKLYLKIT